MRHHYTSSTGAVTASIFRDKKEKISKTRGLGNLASIATATNSVIYGHVLPEVPHHTVKGHSESQGIKHPC